jgi:hypothetical protein
MTMATDNPASQHPFQWNAILQCQGKKEKSGEFFFLF